MCVQVCRCDALTYVEKEDDRDEEAEEAADELEVGLESLQDKYGRQKIIEALARLSHKG
jgi:hypothetical protein